DAVVVAPGADVVDHAVASGTDHRQAAGEIVADRARHRRLGLDEVEAAVADLGLALGREGRRAGGDVDRPGGGVLAEQRALGAAQHLDLLDVAEIERR
nr:hypothetical protein [Tanacetum cinerariifolium]